jgi:hypothetical protein
MEKFPSLSELIFGGGLVDDYIVLSQQYCSIIHFLLLFRDNCIVCQAKTARLENGGQQTGKGFKVDLVGGSDS